MICGGTTSQEGSPCANTLTGSLYSSTSGSAKLNAIFFRTGLLWIGGSFRIGAAAVFFAGSNAGATWDAFLPIFLCTSWAGAAGCCPAAFDCAGAAAGCGVTGSLLFVLSASSNLFPQTVQKRNPFLFAFWQTGQITVPEFSSFFSSFLLFSSSYFLSVFSS